MAEPASTRLGVRSALVVEDLYFFFFCFLALAPSGYRRGTRDLALRYCV